MGNRVTQAHVVTTTPAIDPGTGVMELALFAQDGTPWDPSNPQWSGASSIAELYQNAKA